VLPTLSGRLQTRIFLVGVVGGLWTLLVTPVVRAFVDEEAMGSPALGDVYKVTFSVLIIVLVLGLAWELLYQFLMQFRWEKDWPTFFAYLTGINEGIVAYFVAKGLGSTDVDAAEWRLLLEGLTPAPFLVHFVSTWIVINLFAGNYMKMIFIRWRFRGGRLIGDW
jgi:hypothetical protein